MVGGGVCVLIAGKVTGLQYHPITVPEKSVWTEGVW